MRPAPRVPSRDLQALYLRLGESFLGRCTRRFIMMSGLDRCIVVSSQAFTALIPLLILVASFTPEDQENLVSTTIIRKFGLEGDSAAAVEQLFDTPPDSTGSLSLFSILLLVYSGVSFTRRMGRMYRAAWEQDKGGVRGGLFATLGLFVLILEFFVLYLIGSIVQRLPLDWLWTIPISTIAGTFLWTSIPYLLLNRQVHWRRLVVAGAMTAFATAILGVATTIYMPPWWPVHHRVRVVRHHDGPHRLAVGRLEHHRGECCVRRRVRLLGRAVDQEAARRGSGCRTPINSQSTWTGRLLGRSHRRRRPGDRSRPDQLADHDRCGVGRHAVVPGLHITEAS